MARYFTGIDIGTYHVKVVIAAAHESGDTPLTIVGTGSAQSKGMRHGYIVNTKEATRSIQEAVQKASQAAKVRVKSARVAIGGISLDEVRSSGDVSLTASHGEVTERDIDRAIRESEKRASGKLANHKIIHAIPLGYSIDGDPVIGRALGLKGTKLSVQTLLVTALEQHYTDLVEAVQAAGIEVEDVMAAPLAASLVTLTKPQKIAGVVLANIGAETVSMAVFENDIPVSIKVLPIGSADITNDLALSLKISLDEAEQLKRGAVLGSDTPQKKVDDVVSNRLRDIFNLVDAHLKTIGKQRLLPAGIVITGGGSGLATVSDIARATMKIPSKSGAGALPSRTVSGDATWAVAYGLCKWGFASMQHMESIGFGGMFTGFGETMQKFFRSLMP